MRRVFEEIDEVDEVGVVLLVLLVRYRDRFVESEGAWVLLLDENLKVGLLVMVSISGSVLISVVVVDFCLRVGVELSL